MSSKKLISLNHYGFFDQIMKDYDETIIEISKCLRVLMTKLPAEIFEVPWPKQSIIGYGIGPKKMTQHFCYIAPQKKYVNLGFYNGANISDPYGILEGNGKKLRHIKIYSVDDCKQQSIYDMILLAMKERLEFENC